MPDIETSRKRAREEKLSAYKTDKGWVVHNYAKNTVYETTKTKNEIWYCSCPYMVRGSRLGSVCKHITFCDDLEKTCEFVPVHHRKKIVQYAIVDREDYDKVKDYTWYLYSRKGITNTIYAMRSSGPSWNRVTTYLHREVFNAAPLSKLDHRNGNGLDCRKENLRDSTNSQNAHNWHHKKISNTYRGVFRKDTKEGPKYRAQIAYRTVKYDLGTFLDEVEAAKAYDSKALELFGEFAVTNF